MKSNFTLLDYSDYKRKTIENDYDYEDNDVIDDSNRNAYDSYL
ncbi:MAG: hypothetical protein ACSHWW_08755 [Nonlabens sp.]